MVFIFSSLCTKTACKQQIHYIAYRVDCIYFSSFVQNLVKKKVIFQTQSDSGVMFYMRTLTLCLKPGKRPSFNHHKTQPLVHRSLKVWQYSTARTVLCPCIDRTDNIWPYQATGSITPLLLLVVHHFLWLSTVNNSGSLCF